MSALPASSLESLHQTLIGEIEDYRQLAVLTQQEQVALQDGNLDDLICTVQKKEGLLTRMGKWEKTRQQVIAHLAAILKLPANVSLADLLVFCDEGIAQKLAALRQEFLALSEQIRRLSQGNQLILQSELVRVDATINYLLSDVTAGSYCAPKGGVNSISKLPVAGHLLNWQA
jgi:flagellar biosynthesis/type III secretory pathway chaperone